MITSEKTLTELRQELHVSKSQIRTFLMCPQKYAYQYVLGKEWESKPVALAFGSAIHEAVADFYLSITNEGGPFTVKDVHESFENSWSINSKGDIPLDYNGKSESELIDLGKRMLEVFIEETQPREIEAIELPFSVPIYDPSTGEELPIRLIGAFDLIECDEDGNSIIVELKTSARKWSDGQADNELDPAVYSYAYNQMEPADDSGETLVRFDVLTKTKNPSLEKYFVTKTEEDHRKMLSLFTKVLKAIEKEAFYPNQGWQCNGCAFKRQCADDL